MSIEGFEKFLQQKSNTKDMLSEKLDNEYMKKLKTYFSAETDTELNIKDVREFLFNRDIEHRELSKPFDNIIDIVKEYKEFSITKYPIIKESVFDDFTSDSINFFRDAFITIGGNSSSGKTSLVTQMIKDLMIANDNAICLFYSLDDGAYFGMRKVIQHFTEYYNKMIFDNKKAIPKYTEPITEKYIKDFDNLKNIDIDIDKILKRIVMLGSFNDLKSDIDLIKLRFQDDIKEKTGKNPLIIIALDYLQILSNDTSRTDKSFYSDLVKYLKDIQQAETKEKNGCIFFMLSQINRNSSKSNNADLNSFRETSEIENLSDIAITIDYKEKPNQKKSSNNKTEFITDYKEPNRDIKIVKNKIGLKKDYNAIVNHGVIMKLEDKDKSKDKAETPSNTDNSQIDEFGKTTNKSTLDKINEITNNLGY